MGLGGSLVLAHGGDTAKIHACVDPTIAGRPNVIIVTPDAACPGGYSPVDWSIQGPAGPAGAQGPQGAIGQAGPAGAAARPVPDSTFAGLKKVGPSVVTKLLPPGSKVFTKADGPNKNVYKSAQRLCPETHPDLVSGGYDVTGIDPANVTLAMNQAGLFGWGAPFKEGWQTIALGSSATPWTLKVTVVCKKK